MALPLIVLAGAVGTAVTSGRRRWTRSRMEPLWDDLADRLGVDSPAPGARVLYAWFDGLRVELHWEDAFGIAVRYRVVYHGVGEMVSVKAAEDPPRLKFWRPREDPEFESKFSVRARTGFDESLTPARKRALMALRRAFPAFQMQTHQVEVAIPGVPGSVDDVAETARELAALVRAFLDAPVIA